MNFKKRYSALLPMVVFLSACSTPSQNTDQSQLFVEPTSANSDISDTVSSSLIEQAQALNAKDAEIERLKGELSDNKTQLAQLTEQLDIQEAKINQLSSSVETMKAAHLVELENEKQKLNQLESQYVSLKLANEKLDQELTQLTKQNLPYKEQILSHDLDASAGVEEPEAYGNQAVLENEEARLQGRYDALNSMHQHLLHKYSVLERDYDALDESYQKQNRLFDQLNQNYDDLADENASLQTSYNNLKKMNLDLGGAIADARAQQQVLWDQIQIKDKVISNLEADNSALREKSQSLENITSGQVISTLPGGDNNMELGTLNAKILVLESEIAAQKKLLTEYQEKLSELEQSDNKSDLKNLEIARLGQALADLNAKYEERNAQFEQLDLAQAVSREQQEALLAELAQAQEQVAELMVQKNEAASSLAQAQAELISLQGRYENSLLALESAKETRQSLETQLSDLIELEAISAGFKDQLATSLSNVTWQIPKQIELGASFEIILTANVDDSIAGQVFIAELVSDSSLELISSISAEAQALNGQLQWRWRAKGVSESQLAQVHLFIHQDIQYQEDRVLREVYRDQKTLSLINDNWIEKYGFWVFAILAGLMAGFVMGKINKSRPEEL